MYYHCVLFYRKDTFTMGPQGYCANSLSSPSEISIAFCYCYSATSHNTLQQSQLHTWQSQLHTLCQKTHNFRPWQWCMWRSSKIIGNGNIRYNAHKFVLIFHCNDGRIVSETMRYINCAISQVFMSLSTQQLMYKNTTSHAHYRSTVFSH